MIRNGYRAAPLSSALKRLETAPLKLGDWKPYGGDVPSTIQDHGFLVCPPPANYDPSTAQ